MPFTLTEALTLAIASVGAVLGIINTWHQRNQRKVKLWVVPKHAIPVGALEGFNITMCIEVINLSTFPVTVSDVGVLYRGTDVRGAVVQPIFIDGGSFPRRLEPRAAFTAYMAGESIGGRDNHRVKCAYARTDCGVTATGTSPALRQIAGSHG